MIPDLRRDFNARFTSERYRCFLDGLDRSCGTKVTFRICETPCFFPAALIDELASVGRELLLQLVNSPEYMRASAATVPPEFNVPGESPHPLFAAMDFGLVRNPAGGLEPKLVEIQGFPSLYAFQVVFAQQYIESYGLDARLGIIPGGASLADYWSILRRAIVAGHDPENVVLLEIDPLEQKTLPDFLATERAFGIRTVNIRAVMKEGNRLFYPHAGKRIPIRRIYNRAIADELVRKQVQLPFDFRDPLDVEWAGHPNWFFRISKFSIPHLRHACVPRTWFLDSFQFEISDLKSAAGASEGSSGESRSQGQLALPADLENFVLKPLYSFAGLGVVVGPTRADLDAIPRGQRHNYILQERLDFAPVIDTPHGPTKVEIRVLYIWPEDSGSAAGESNPLRGPAPAPPAGRMPALHLGPLIVRMGRGKQMGVDHNRDLEWVGASAGLIAE